MPHRHSIVLLVTFCLLVLGGVMLAGPLDPPAGPVVETDTALRSTDPRVPVGPETTPGDADSVFRIVEPGSYFLAGNITSAASRYAVEISSSNVTLDLNGFEIVGVPGSFDGVRVTTPGVTGVAVENGVIRDHGFRGINFAASNAAGAVFRDLRVSGNGSDGMLTGNRALVVDCSALSNNGDGIRAGEGTLVRDSVASFNQNDGIQANNDCRVVGCVTKSNVLTGINTIDSVSVEGSIANENGQHGISVGRNCVVRGNLCDGNDENGIDVRGSLARVIGNHSTNNDVGVRSNSSRGIYLGNTCGSNTTENWIVPAGNGILVVEIGLASPAVVGSSGGVSPGGSSNPHANWSY